MSDTPDDPDALDAPIAPDEPAPSPIPAPKAADGMKISFDALARARQKVDYAKNRADTFTPYAPPPFVFPGGKKPAGLAMDSVPAVAIQNWAVSNPYNLALSQGYSFLGYQVLAELTVIPEYRLISEVLATEMTRKWIKIQSAKDEADKKGGGSGKSQEGKINDLIAELERLDARECFRRVAEQDGFYGRSHIYIDTGDTDDRDELMTPIGDGSKDNRFTKAKIKKGDIQALRVIEPVWCYPANYNANNPLKREWYQPDTWFCMGTEIHRSRLLTFVGREVPDLLKPAFSFGGLSLSQMSMPYVDNWLQTRQSVSDLIQAFSQMVLSTDMSTVLQGGGGESLFNRIDLFNQTRNNRGTMAINKDTEDFKNVAAPISGLDALQAQSQEHMCTPSRTPGVKLFGITPKGLNPSADGEIRVWYDTVNAHQQKFFSPHLTTIFHFAQINLWGAVDEDLSYIYEKLYEMTEKEQAEIREKDGKTANDFIDRGVIDPREQRQVLASNPASPYAHLIPENVPKIEEPEPKNIRETERKDEDEDGGEEDE